MCEYNILSTGRTPFHLFAQLVASYRIRTPRRKRANARRAHQHPPVGFQDTYWWCPCHWTSAYHVYRWTWQLQWVAGTFHEVQRSLCRFLPKTWLHFHSCGMVKAMQGDCYSLKGWRFNEVVDCYWSGCWLVNGYILLTCWSNFYCVISDREPSWWLERGRIVWCCSWLWLNIWWVGWLLIM